MVTLLFYIYYNTAPTFITVFPVKSSLLSSSKNWTKWRKVGHPGIWLKSQNEWDSIDLKTTQNKQKNPQKWKLIILSENMYYGLQLTAPLYWKANFLPHSKAGLTQISFLQNHFTRRHWLLFMCQGNTAGPLNPWTVSMVPYTVFGLTSLCSPRQVPRGAQEQRQLEKLFS